jgi:Tol biopolymer transport system component
MDLPAMLPGSPSDYAVPTGTTIQTDCWAWRYDGQAVACNVFAVLTLNPRHEYSGIWGVSTDGHAWEIWGNDPMSEGGGYASVGGWTRDGELIQFGLTRPGIVWQEGTFPRYTVPATGGEATLQDRDFLASLQGGTDSNSISLYSDGGGPQTWTNKRIALFDLRSGSKQYLTDIDTAAISPTWSPDFTQITFVAAPDTGSIAGLERLLEGEQAAVASAGVGAARQSMAQRHLWIMSADGSNQRQLTDDDRYRDERALWSRDATRLLFPRIDAEGNASVWLLPISGGDPVKVADVSPCASRGCSPSSALLRDTSGPWWFGYYGTVPWEMLYCWWQPDHDSGNAAAGE